MTTIRKASIITVLSVLFYNMIPIWQFALIFWAIGMVITHVEI